MTEAFVVIWWAGGLILVAGATHWVMGLVEAWVYARRVEVTPRRAQRDMAAIGRGGYPGGPTPPGEPPVSPLFTRPEARTSWTIDAGPGTYNRVWLPATGEIATFPPVTLRGAGQITVELPVATTGKPKLINDPPDVSWIEFEGKRPKTVVQDWAGNLVTTLHDQYRRPAGVLSSERKLTAEAVRVMETAWRTQSLHRPDAQ